MKKMLCAALAAILSLSLLGIGLAEAPAWTTAYAEAMHRIMEETGKTPDDWTVEEYAALDLEYILEPARANGDDLSDQWIHCLPQDGSISQDEARALAREAIAEANGVDSSAFDGMREIVQYFVYGDPDSGVEGTWRFDYIDQSGNNAHHFAEINAFTREVVNIYHDPDPSTSNG